MQTCSRFARALQCTSAPRKMFLFGYIVGNRNLLLQLLGSEGCSFGGPIDQKYQYIYIYIYCNKTHMYKYNNIYICKHLFMVTYTHVYYIYIYIRLDPQYE